MAKHVRILVVDDDADIRNTLKTILIDEGYAVDVAANGKEAIKKSETTVYNLALIDICLPDMVGTELLYRLRDTVPRMRKIMITGYPSVDNAIDAVNLKADAYLVKPLNVDKLLKTIQAHLELQQAERQYSEEKIVEFIEARIREYEQNRH
ncbi:MAG: response regulator [Candidatus Bathyarchaeales archaeon]